MAYQEERTSLERALDERIYVVGRNREHMKKRLNEARQAASEAWQEIRECYAAMEALRRERVSIERDVAILRAARLARTEG